MKTRKNIFFKIITILTALIIIIAGIALYLYKGNATTLKKNTYVKLSSSDNIESLAIKLETECGLKHPYLFKLIAQKMNLEKWMKKGRYELHPGLTLIDVARVFREGKGKTINFTIKGLNSLETFAELCGNKLEGDASDFLALIKDPSFLATIEFNTQTVYALPLPDTYNIYWHTEPDELLIKLKAEYDKYWTIERREKATKAGLTPIQVATLASIVSKETNKIDEMQMVAGMYINRLNINMPLQADPTIKFALNEPGLQRIYNVHLQVVSPYNTYMNKGLPPGPICIPSKQSIEAVLNFTQHSYLFMCAKEDFSGYHNFAITYREHLLNAKKYRVALDRNGVK